MKELGCPPHPRGVPASPIGCHKNKNTRTIGSSSRVSHLDRFVIPVSCCNALTVTMPFRISMSPIDPRAHRKRGRRYLGRPNPRVTGPRLRGRGIPRPPWGGGHPKLFHKIVKIIGKLLFVHDPPVLPVFPVPVRSFCKKRNF